MYGKWDAEKIIDLNQIKYYMKAGQGLLPISPLPTSPTGLFPLYLMPLLITTQQQKKKGRCKKKPLTVSS